MDEQNLNVVDAAQENVVDSQEVTESTETTKSAEVTETTEQQTETEQNKESVIEEVAKPQQSAEDNAKFASVRREAEKKARDSVIAEMYGKSHGIHTYEQYQQAVAEQEKQKQIDELGDIPEEVAREIVEARELKAKIAKEESDRKSYLEFIENFPGVDANKIPTEVWEIVAKGKDLTSAYALYQVKNMDKIKTETEQETLKKIKQNAETSTGSIQSNAQSNDSMTVDQVNKLLEGMGKGERDKWIDKNMDNLEKWGYFKQY
jgi:hypothetical protein